MSVAAQIRRQLAVLQPVALELEDESAAHVGHAGAREGGGHYRLSIVSPCFAGQSTVARHRMVYDALGSLMRQQVHALSIIARTPDETRRIPPTTR